MPAANIVKAAAIRSSSDCRSRFSASKMPNPHTRRIRHNTSQQFSWLTHPQRAHSLLREIPNDRLSSCVRPPRSQWRLRPGFTPGSLFSIRPLRHPDGTETVSNYTILFLFYTRFQEKSTAISAMRAAPGWKPVPFVLSQQQERFPAVS